MMCAGNRLTWALEIRGMQSIANIDKETEQINKKH